ncbi:hypothetical protein TNCV_3682151 [Trichonephila clavipes]|uniref:Uncharacterized protein n=1 Tax=Trichonephila clavipes TaxID=2585209 RepID=A0A8X6RG56_TRICX|nr:hypothetical protein TNCV_3682151 [Trichonephila clavipes]
MIRIVIKFKVFPLGLHTLSLILLPKTLLEGFLWNGVQLHRRVLPYRISTLKTGSYQLNYLISTRKTGSYQWNFHFWEKSEVSKSQVSVESNRSCAIARRSFSVPSTEAWEQISQSLCTRIT